MKILVLAGKVPDTQSLSSGWLNAFNAMGHTAVAWHSTTEPAFDTFDRVMPDLVWVHSRDLSRDGMKALVGEKTKTILFVSNWNDATEKEKEYVEKLVHAGTQLAFNTSFASWIDKECDGWKSLGLTTLSCLPAADATQYYPVELDERYKTDISLIACYEERKEKLYHELVFPIAKKFDLKLYGYGPWPIANHLGYLNKDMMRVIICNSKVNLTVSPENATAPSERIYKIMACGKTPFYLVEGLPLQELINNTDKYEDKSVLEYIKYGNTYEYRVKQVFADLGVKG